MINRGVTKTSAYVFNSKTGMLEKKEENVQTIESLSKQAKKNVKNTDNLANDKSSKEPINNITVITADDNLIHNYFSHFETSWDASNCLSTAIIKMPKMNTENTSYWINYNGQVTVYAGYNFTFDHVNGGGHETEQDAANSLAKYWDNSDIKPFFRGEVSRVKEYENDITLYVASIGRRFQQKIPDEFRQKYINNQNVRDAFQAICEFLGVQYICPPKTTKDNGETETEETEPKDGTENDVSMQERITSNIKNIVDKKVEDEANKAQNNKNNTNGDNSDSTNSQDQNNTDGTITDNQEIEPVQNGYGNINFDANGAIVHNSAVIEDSPDMAEVLIQMEENPLEKYIEDETGVVEKVQKFLDGDMFEEIHNSIMNYDSITIQPASTNTSNISSMGDSTAGASGQTGENGESNGESGDSSSSGSSGGGSSGGGSSGVKGVWGKTQGGSYYLTKEAINKMSPDEANRRYLYGQQHNIYTANTMEKLWYRSNGIWLF